LPKGVTLSLSKRVLPAGVWGEEYVLEQVMAISNVIDEHDVVELLLDFGPTLVKGMRGTVIIEPRTDLEVVHVEFADRNGETIEMLDIPKSALQVFWKMNDHAVIEFEHGWSERDDHETPAKGWRGDVMAILPSGTRYRLVFYDPSRSEQHVSEDGYLSERNLVLVNRTDRATIEDVVHRLYRTGELQLNYRSEAP
jgi:hypothetical protein